ncbi:DDE superfamily endonuclease [Hirsutella rhossiliensis]|uniref:DDE superfamily endonuclease domain-containing protein n=1 Tax=Hirsutella rhossiliensis TaxID=111463 RepID=A0A9P8MYJ9_9HYPO|nr:DDE superfamily endonuclease domain-containing protein [Hirsutella rhossiliensis]KAH0962651.1 DDE superfamily endonuclease domain-containing protein [Hirsutella rhossiliensis]
MPNFQPDQSLRAANAAREYLDGDSLTRTTRANPAPPRVLTINELAVIHKTNEGLVKKYIRLLRANLALPSGGKGGAPTALTDAEEKSLLSYARLVEGGTFALTEACLINKANFIRHHRRQGLTSQVSRSWLTRFKRRHPELAIRRARIQEITRAGAELEVDELEAWFHEYQAVIKELRITPENLWNFDETPLQLGWMKGSLKLVSLRMKRSRRPVFFQPGNKESLTSCKVLLEEYTMATISDDVVVTYTTTGYNNSQRAFQWLQHFNRYSFARKQWERRTFYTQKTKTVFRLLVMDGFAAHEDPEFIWYCEMFEIVPFKLPSHTSHLLQPLDVGVYQHLKRAQQGTLKKFVIGGGTRISRFDFLCQWNELFSAAFKACYIFVGFEQSGYGLLILNISKTVSSERGAEPRPYAESEALTMAPLRYSNYEKAAARQQEDQEASAKRALKDSETQFRHLRAMDAAQTASQPRLRGGAAVAAKAVEEAKYRTYIQQLVTPEEAVAREALQERWTTATEGYRYFLWATHPKGDLTALPDIVAWSQAQEEARAQAAANVADEDSDIDHDYISMLLSSEPDLAPNSDDDEDDIQIITTQRQRPRIARPPLSQLPLEQLPPRQPVQLNEEDEAAIQAELKEERVIVGVYSDEDDEEEDEPEVVIYGRRIAVPKTRVRQA